MNILSSPNIRVYRLVISLFIGMSLISNSFTSIRGDAVGGPFEVMLLFFVIALSLTKLLSGNKLKYLPLIPFCYLFFFMAPLTILNTYLDLMGSDIRTLVALMFGSFLAFNIANTSLEEQKFIAYGSAGVLLIAFLAALIIEVDFNNLARLLLFSENPNQIALYSLCSFYLIATTIKSNLIAIILSIPAAAYGILSLSDTYILALAIISMFFFLQYLSSGKYLVILLIIWLIFGVLVWILISNIDLLTLIQDIWYGADEGGGRTILAYNGLLAFKESPVFGYGAGAFSGTELPLMRYEAHNTFIDFLTMGGIFWVLIFYIPFFWAFYSYMKKKDFILAGILFAIIVFSSFHFIGRHPIIWFIYAYCVSNFLNSMAGKT